jgi:hypothetical protein
MMEDLVGRGAEGVVLGCTELAMLLPDGTRGPPRAVDAFTRTPLHQDSAFMWIIIHTVIDIGPIDRSIESGGVMTQSL